MRKPEPIVTMLKQHAERLQSQPLSALFTHDPERFQRFSITAEGILFDFSKNLIDEAAYHTLLQLAAPVADWQAKMRAGAYINSSEQRPVLHPALRHPLMAGYSVDGQNIMPAIHAVLQRMRDFSHAILSGEYRGYRDHPITDIVNIGIGGSDLGPRLAAQALRPYQQSLRCHFVANVDGFELHHLLPTLNPATTLFIVTSKSFTTRETMLNAATARNWFTQQAPASAVEKHFVAISANQTAVRDFGIAPQHIFEFWDWVGGRFSVWSAVGLALMLAIGPTHFDAFLAGAHQIDNHFFSAPAAQNMPILMALIGYWNRSILGYNSLCIAPYHAGLEALPTYLQQLDMESNGKQVQRDGLPVATPTAPIVWGQAGTNCQHAFFQLLHQGTEICPVDFIAAAQAAHPYVAQQRSLLANCLAQAEALLQGRPFDAALASVDATAVASTGQEEVATASWQMAQQRHFPGNRPSNMLLLPRLGPHELGMLLALYEHKIFVQGVLWQINSFDQWGVELGKSLAQNLERDLVAETIQFPHDSSTLGLLAYLKAQA
ncbi:glucose-6-phosphate isomerase [Parvibium lacunae]|uniref:Glucose-6-phosphate isomerase n=1 Tax=Parvibium lacunae TaxID=1888893 RepID=A0A368L8C0_9BURK|nr:glucose-6-phosphate isomerase [Parvibium lacunae]RCS59948.1 glucose-6-phosphate isomerase [Parvibium lacunae]